MKQFAMLAFVAGLIISTSGCCSWWWPCYGGNGYGGAGNCGPGGCGYGPPAGAGPVYPQQGMYSQPGTYQGASYSTYSTVQPINPTPAPVATAPSNPMTATAPLESLPTY